MKYLLSLFLLLGLTACISNQPECPICKGEGEAYNVILHQVETCRYCEGEGRVSQEKYDLVEEYLKQQQNLPEMVNCPNCSGAGYEQFTGRYCMECGGSGRVSRSYFMDAMSQPVNRNEGNNRNSSSSIQLTCKTCYGTGNCRNCDSNGHPHVGYGVGYDYARKCTICNGSNKCPTCGGSGHQ